MSTTQKRAYSEKPDESRTIISNAQKINLTDKL